MSLDDYNDLLNEVSPKYYRQFRLLYNEMLGYLDREEYDKLSEFSTKVQQKLGNALQLQKKLQQRLNAMHRQQKIVQKQALYYQFKHPKQTIPYSPMFPLKRALKAEPEELPKESLDPASAKDRKIDQLLSEMERFDQHKQVNKLNQGMTAKPSEIAANLNQAPTTADYHKQTEQVESATVEEAGESLNEDLVEDKLHITKQKELDIERSEQCQPLPDSDDLSEQPQVPDQEQSPDDRKKRVWDYIDEDQKRGNINDSR